MQVISNVYILSKTEGRLLANLGLLRPDDMCNIPNPRDLFFISLCIFPIPEKVWPHDSRMAAYCNEKIKKLIELKLVDEGTISKLKEVKSENNYLHVVICFPNLKTADSAFEKMISAGFVDIYLYANEELIKKYD